MKGVHQVSVSFQGEPVKGSPFELRVHCVSAEKSSLEANVTDTSFLFSDVSRKVTITAVDQDGTPLTQGGDKFTGMLSVNGQPQVSPNHFNSSLDQADFLSQPCRTLL